MTGVVIEYWQRKSINMLAQTAPHQCAKAKELSENHRRGYGTRKAGIERIKIKRMGDE